MKNKAFGTHEVARICLVTPATVGNWIEKGLLPTFTTGGGHRRVWAEDLVQFLRKHNIPIPKQLENQSQIRILIVDDEEEIVSVIKRIIRKEFKELEISTAGDGFEAGQKVVSEKPNLVILDLRLPGVDGFEICRRIKAENSLKDIKILAISGYNIEKYRLNALEAGADDFLPKPFTTEELKEKIKKIISGVK